MSQQLNVDPLAVVPMTVQPEEEVVLSQIEEDRIIEAVSPTVTVTAIDNGIQITITDKNGTTTANVYDGQDGEDGADGVGIASVTLNADYTLTITFTDGNSTTTESIRGEKGETGETGQTGPAGQDGADGQDGVSAYVHIKYAASEPTQDSDMKSTPDAWMGIYSGTSSTAPTAYTSYTWYKIRGEDGAGAVEAVKMNGSTIQPDQDHIVDLGTVLTAHQDISGKVDKNQGSAYAGKVLGIGNDGMVTPVPFSGDDFTGATASTAGVHGYVPAPAAGDQEKVLQGNGVWGFVASKAVTVALDTVTNVSGSYSHTTYDQRVTADMTGIAISLSNPAAFNANIQITCDAGSVTLACDDVAGTSTVTVTLLKQVPSDPTQVTSTEFDVLANRIGTLANLNTTEKSSLVGAVNEVTDQIENPDSFTMVSDNSSLSIIDQNCYRLGRLVVGSLRFSASADIQSGQALVKGLPKGKTTLANASSFSACATNNASTAAVLANTAHNDAVISSASLFQSGTHIIGFSYIAS